MEKEKNSKKTLIVLASVLLLLILVAGFFILGKEPQEAVVLEGSSAINQSIIGADALLVISQINSLRLNSQLMTNANFVSLTDRTRDITTEQAGRENPFSSIR